MKRVAPLFSLLLIFVLSCTDRDDDLTAINIRIKNVSEVAYARVQVGAEDKIHENVASGEFSEYLEYEEAFRYAFIEIMAEDQTYTLQPIDFVGETPLSLGFYTYELNITESGDVILEFKVD